MAERLRLSGDFLLTVWWVLLFDSPQTEGFFFFIDQCYVCDLVADLLGLRVLIKVDDYWISRRAEWLLIRHKYRVQSFRR
jgi:hypothetical protein